MPKHITIRFYIDKKGARRAVYFGRALRWLPISIEEAETKLANDPRYVLSTLAHLKEARQ